MPHQGSLSIFQEAESNVARLSNDAEEILICWRKFAIINCSWSSPEFAIEQMNEKIWKSFLYPNMSE